MYPSIRLLFTIHHPMRDNIKTSIRDAIMKPNMLVFCLYHYMKNIYDPKIRLDVIIVIEPLRHYMFLHNQTISNCKSWTYAPQSKITQWNYAIKANSLEYFQYSKWMKHSWKYPCSSLFSLPVTVKYNYFPNKFTPPKKIKSQDKCNHLMIPTSIEIQDRPLPPKRKGQQFSSKIGEWR